MSLLVGVLDTGSMSFEYANAGHPCPLHVRGGQVEPFESHGMLTGVLPESEYHRSRAALAAGDLLVFFSDGITEAAGRQSRMVRSSGVAEAVLRGPRDSAAAVVRAVTAALQPGGASISDDRTLLVVRLPG
jgi:sigma-B regulation protein RsbU (phosphoserine phosphatase)